MEWSFPENGQTDVPTNVKLFVLPSAAGVRINGIESSSLDSLVMWDPGQLAPNTNYLVEVDYRLENSDIATSAFAFKTGSIVAAPPENVTVTAIGPAGTGLGCSVVNDFDCIDDAPSGQIRLTTAATGVVLWRSDARGREWQPASCGSPSIEWIGYLPPGPVEVCGTLDAYGAEGTVVETIESCIVLNGCELDGGQCTADPTDEDEQGEAVYESGCGSTPTSRTEPLLALLLVLGVTTRRRLGPRRR
jgi:hypothetical protein